MNRYYDLTLEERLNLDSESIGQSIKLEACHRGIEVPMSISDLMKQEGYVGYTIPSDVTPFWEILAPGNYDRKEPTGLAFKTIEEANAVLKSAISILHETYPTRVKVVTGDFGVQQVFPVTDKAYEFRTKLQEYSQDLVPYNELCEAIMDELSELKQTHYNIRVLKEKRQQYLDLANGDVEIAKAFWNKVEKTSWTEEGE